MAKRNELKNKILHVLKNYPKSRDSDQWLTLKLWCIYYPTRVHEVEENGKKRKFVYLTDVLDLPREDHIKRIRAIIQNEEGRFLPTSLEVAKQRRILEVDWHAYVKRQEQLF